MHMPLFPNASAGMTFVNAGALFVSALLGGALNSVAGGGSFFVFPTLLFLGVAPITANATTTVALWPGSVASVRAYRTPIDSPRVLVLVGTSLLGGWLGAVLLLHTPRAAFERMIPYLLLLATLLFAFSDRITGWLQARRRGARRSTWQVLAAVSAAQLIIATYGGFFGGGIGILMIVTLSLMGIGNIHAVNALKTLLATCINGVAVAVFVIARAVDWSPASIMIVGAIIGGYASAYYARRIDPMLIRRFVILVGTGMTVYFLVRS